MFIKINSEIPKFQCNACGSCCSHIRGIIPKEDREFIKENAFGKLPVVQLVPVEQMTFPLWDWEAKRFMEWQKEANVDARIKPLRAIMDLNSNKAIILTYFMDSETDACPFLENNKCSIYHTKRAYVCRLFPFNRSPFLQQEGMLLKENLFGECGAMEHILPQLPDDFSMSEIARDEYSSSLTSSKQAISEHAQKSRIFDEMVKFLNGAFPDGSFINAVQNDIIIEWANKIIIGLMRKKIINPAINYPYEFLLERIGNSEKIDFTDFLVGAGYLTEEEKEGLISRFDNNLDAIEKTRPFLNYTHGQK